MVSDRLVEAVREHAARDARAFREKFPNDEPNERWIENSFTAALPLANGDVGNDVATDRSGVQPQLFAAYKEEVARVLGIEHVRTASEDDRKDDRHDVIQQPTPGEN